MVAVGGTAGAVLGAASAVHDQHDGDRHDENKYESTDPDPDEQTRLAAAAGRLTAGSLAIRCLAVLTGLTPRPGLLAPLAGLLPRLVAVLRLVALLRLLAPLAGLLAPLPRLLAPLPRLLNALATVRRRLVALAGLLPAILRSARGRLAAPLPWLLSPRPRLLAGALVPRLLPSLIGGGRVVRLVAHVFSPCCGTSRDAGRGAPRCADRALSCLLAGDGGSRPRSQRLGWIT